MFLSNQNSFNYLLTSKESINDVNPDLQIMRMEYPVDCNYALSISPVYLKLCLRKKSKNFKIVDDKIVFVMNKQLMKLDFFYIEERCKNVSRNYTARLLIEVYKVDFLFSERSGLFNVKQPKKQIAERKKKFISDINVPIKNFNNAFYKENLSELIHTNQSDINGSEESLDNSIEFYPDKSEGITDVSKTCVIVNCIDFKDHCKKRRGWSVKNVLQINRLFGLCNFSIKGIINPRTKDILNILQDLHGQVVIFIMSHGNNSGFCTYDSYLYIKDFLDGVPVNHNSRIVIIFGNCQEYSNSLLDDKNYVRSVTDYITDFRKDVFMSISTGPGNDSGANRNGNIYVTIILKIIKHKLMKCTSCDLIEVLKALYPIYGLYKGDILIQEPWYVGDFTEEFILTMNKDHSKELETIDISFYCKSTDESSENSDSQSS